MDDEKQDGLSHAAGSGASTLSPDLPFNVSSTNLRLRSPSTLALDNATISTASDQGSVDGLASLDAMQFNRDFSPYELFASRAVIAAVALFLDRTPTDDEHNAVLDMLPMYRTSSLAAALAQASNGIRFNAKWFSADAVADLLHVSVEAVHTSASSAELDAALLLVNTTATYSFLSPESLTKVARLLAYAYHQGSRSNRSRKLAKEAWTVATRIFQSHLGPQLLDALLAITGYYSSVKDPREGFAPTHGALAMTTHLLFHPAADLPSLEVSRLLDSLLDTANSEDSMLHEDVLAILTKILRDPDKVHAMDEEAAWDTFLAATRRCLKAYPTNHKAADALLDALQHWLDKIEPRLLPVIARLYLRVHRPLTSLLEYGLAEEMLKSTTCEEAAKSGEIFDILQQSVLSKNGANLLSKFGERSLTELLFAPGDGSAFRDLVSRYCHLISIADDEDAVNALAISLVRTFIESKSPIVDQTRFQVLFEALCRIASYSPFPAKMLFRIRADAGGDIFFQADASSHGIPSNQVLHTATRMDGTSVSQWFEVVITVIRDGAQSWDLYSLFITEMIFLLANRKIFDGRSAVLKSVKNIVLDLLHGKGLAERFPSDTKPAIVAKLLQILTVLIGYHRELAKDDVTKDDMLNMIAILINTAGYGDFDVSKSCIHGLTMCCYEVPHLMSSVMDSVIDKMSKMVTQRFLGIHVLQFLATLSRLPALYNNFAQRDYMRIFGVCLAYLRSTRGETTSVERKRTPNSHASATPEDALPEYVYALAHHVITFWYIAMSRANREGLREYITKSLTYYGEDGRRIVEDQGVVTIDMMDRTDADEDVPDEVEPFFNTDGRISTRTRLAGLLLVHTETALRTGRTLLTVRRPSGTSTRMVKGSEKVRITLMAGEDNYLTMLPEDELGMTYGRIMIPRPDSILGASQIVTLPENNDGARRAIQALDRISALDSHKAGVIYIGEDQTKEDDIFLNVSGSPDYRDFVTDLGTTQRLRGAKFNTQGLDREGDEDGEFAIVWNNKVTEMVFHVTTMMPNSDDVLSNTARKKRHIGNDFVNVVFNNSGARLTYETLYNIFPSAFGYVYIVITPSARTSFVQARTLLPEKREDRWFRVKVLHKPDYPTVSPASQEKVVSGASLAEFVRNLALNDCVVSLMKSPRGEMAEYPSSWRARMLQLRTMSERYGTKS